MKHIIPYTVGLSLIKSTLSRYVIHQRLSEVSEIMKFMEADNAKIEGWVKEMREMI